MQIRNRKDQAKCQKKRLKRQARRKVNLEAYHCSIQQESLNAFKYFLTNFNNFINQQKTLEETSGGESATDKSSSNNSGNND